jgi:ABC-type phosphonate transport system ATPase subunit
MIRVSHLSKEYGKCKAVTDISFTLMPGTIAGKAI